MPYEFYSPPALSHIASLIGKPIYLHPQTLDMTNFEVAKVFTEIDLHKPLPEIVNARFESEEIVRVEVSCPHLPSICKLCLEVGHTSKRCTQAPPPYGVCKNAFHVESLCPLLRKTKQPVKEKSVLVSHVASEENPHVGVSNPESASPFKEQAQPVVDTPSTAKKAEEVAFSVANLTTPMLSCRVSH